jgi:hypothetical protein
MNISDLHYDFLKDPVGKVMRSLVLPLVYYFTPTEILFYI